MPRLTNKSFTARAPQTGGSVPELPDFNPEFAAQPGGERTNAALQRWWDIVRQRIEFNNGRQDQRFREFSRTIDGITGSITEIVEITSDVEDYLEARYTINVTAGPVVTGMTLFSSTGPDTEVSYVSFQADRFQINTSGGGNKQLFSATASAVKLGDVLTVDLLNAKMYIGSGTYANAGTYFYVDTVGGGRMSLGTQFVWDGSTLSVNRISATTGTIGSWTINATTISSNNAILDSAGQLILGTANDIVYLSATDPTYRIWIGNVTAGSASFRVSKTGVLTASGGTFSGTITSTSGTIGGFTIGATDLSAGSGATAILLSSTAASGIIVGDASALHAKLFRGAGTVTGVELFNSSNISVGLFACVSSGTNAGSLDLRTTLGVSTISLDGQTGAIVATTFAGSGASLTSLNASNISSGTLNNARLPSAISVTTLDASGDISGNELNIVGTEVINNSLELVSLKLVLNPSSGVRCDLRFDDHAGADSVFANYMKINGNGGTIYVPYRSSAP